MCTRGCQHGGSGRAAWEADGRREVAALGLTGCRLLTPGLGRAQEIAAAGAEQVVAVAGVEQVVAAAGVEQESVPVHVISVCVSVKLDWVSDSVGTCI